MSVCAGRFRRCLLSFIIWFITLCEWVCLFCCPVLYWNHTALQERYSSCILASSSSRASRGAFRTSLLAAVTLTPCGCATAAAGGSFAEAVRFNVAVHLGFRARRTPIAFAQMGMGLQVVRAAEFTSPSLLQTLLLQQMRYIATSNILFTIGFRGACSHTRTGKG